MTPTRIGTPPVPDVVLQEAVDCLGRHKGNQTAAAAELGISRAGLQSRIRRADQSGIKLGRGIDNPNDIEHLRVKLKRSEQELTRARETSFDERVIRETIIKLTSDVEHTTPPDWLIKPMKAASKSPGVPTLFASDWHFGEVVDSSQIGGVNRFNMTIGRNRARRMIETAIDLLNNHMVNPNYPGIVFALGGDMVSGDIHEELTATNEKEIMPVVLDLFGILTWCIETLANEFGKVFLPCVGGNHGRNTQKIRAKGRNFTSFDWLLYSFLAKRFENDKRVSFLIPNGPDALFKIYNHRYLLTHGDQFRGGDGMIGALGPIIRGDHRKRSRNGQIDQEYDTMMLGHWHQLIQLQRLIVNGSLKGYDEYAYANNFGFEPPRQAMWITHHEHGITFTMPVNVEDKKQAKIQTNWVSVTA